MLSMRYGRFGACPQTGSISYGTKSAALNHGARSKTDALVSIANPIRAPTFVRAWGGRSIGVLANRDNRPNKTPPAIVSREGLVVSAGR